MENNMIYINQPKNVNVLRGAIRDLALDTEDATKNYTLATIYDSMNQTASAITYFYRAAERTEDKTLSYECLLRSALCYDRQGNRHNTVKRIMQHAIYLLPKRPEAYFLLSRLLERTHQYVDGYMIASMGLGVCDFNLPPLKSNVDYAGKYNLIFEKAICGWWWGKNDESRALLRELSEQYHNVMDPIHKKAVYDNLSRLGINRSKAFKHYDQSKHNRLKFKFAGSEKITKTYSQVYQDLFVLSVLNGKENGRYFEIGSSDPTFNSNTFLLEKDFHWIGLGIDIDPNAVEKYNSTRKNSSMCCDATTVNYDSLLSTLAVDGVIDYLQVDCDPAKTTFDILLSIPFDKYKFRTITYEHDYYLDDTKSYRYKSRKYLESLGYKLVAGDISPEGQSSFEDWWVHGDLVDDKILDIMQCDISGVVDPEIYLFYGENDVR